jgi:hypothetical protein
MKLPVDDTDRTLFSAVTRVTDYSVHKWMQGKIPDS